MMILVSRPMFFMVNEFDGAIYFHQWPSSSNVMTFVKLPWILFVFLSVDSVCFPICEQEISSSYRVDLQCSIDVSQRVTIIVL